MRLWRSATAASASREWPSSCSPSALIKRFQADLSSSGVSAGGVQRGKVFVIVIVVVNELQRHPLSAGVSSNRQSIRHSVNADRFAGSFHGRDWSIDRRMSRRLAPVIE